MNPTLKPFVDGLFKCAMYMNDYEKIKLYLENGADIHEDNDQALIDAVKEGDIVKVKILIEHGADVHARGEQALRSAILNDNQDMMTLLLDNGANVHTQNDILQTAIVRGSPELVKTLFEKMNITDYYPENVVEWFIERDTNNHVERKNFFVDAVKYDSVEHVEIMIHTMRCCYNVSSIVSAGLVVATTRNLDMVKLLLKNGAKDDNALAYAVYHEDTETAIKMIELLLEHGADIHFDNDIALRNAVFHDEYEIVKTLLKHGADVHANEDEALRSITRLVRSNYHPIEMVKLLIEHGADISAKSHETLRLASENGYIKLVEILLKHGADVHAEEDYALRMASENGHFDIVKLLIEHGADPCAENSEAVIHRASTGKLENCDVYIKILKLLIKNGADIRAEDDVALRKALYAGLYERAHFIADYIESPDESKLVIVEPVVETDVESVIETDVETVADTTDVKNAIKRVHNLKRLFEKE